MSLRRVLRDHPAIAIPVRLRALAPDELAADEVLAELRQHDRISIDLAAAVHDLLELRRRLKEGAAVGPGDGASACLVADRLEAEVSDSLSPAPTSEPPAPGDPLAAADAPAPEPDPAAPDTPEMEDAEPRGRRPLVYWGAGAALLLLLLVPLAFWLAN